MGNSEELKNKIQECKEGFEKINKDLEGDLENPTYAMQKFYLRNALNFLEALESNKSFSDINDIYISLRDNYPTDEMFGQVEGLKKLFDMIGTIYTDFINILEDDLPPLEEESLEQESTDTNPEIDAPENNRPKTGQTLKNLANRAKQFVSSTYTNISDSLNRRAEERKEVRAARVEARERARQEMKDRRDEFATEREGIAYQVLKNSRGIVQQVGARLVREYEVRSGKESNWGRKSTKDVYTEETRELTANIATVVNMRRTYWNESVKFVDGQVINMPDYSALLFNNLSHILVVNGGKLTSTIKPEIANNLSQSQLKLLDKNMQKIIDKIYLIDNHIQRPDRFSFNVVTSYLEELEYITSKCQDIYSSVVSSDKYLEHKEEELRACAIDSFDWAGQKQDIKLAFQKMGFKIDFSNGNVEELKPRVTIGQVTPFTVEEVKTFIQNYNDLSDSDKRDFTIQGLFDVFVSRAKDQVMSRLKDDPTRRAEYLAEIDKQKEDFSVDGKDWKLLAMASGSERDYASFMMRALITYRDYGVSQVKNDSIVKYKDVQAWEKLVSSLQNESQVEAKIEEIRAPYIEAIANETLQNNGVINKNSNVYNAYKQILALDTKINKKDLDKTISQQVYDFLEKNNQLDPKIKSFDDWQNVQGFVSIPTASSTGNSTPSSDSEPTTDIDEATTEGNESVIDEIIKIIANESNVDFIANWIEANDLVNNTEQLKTFEESVTKNMTPENVAELKETIANANLEDGWLAYCVVNGLIEDYKTEKGIADDTPISDIWEGVKEVQLKKMPQLENSATSTGTAGSQSTNDVYSYGKDIKAFGLFYTLFNDLKNRKSTEPIETLVDGIASQTRNIPQEFFEQLKKCLAKDECKNNSYYKALLEKAKEDLLIAKYISSQQDPTEVQSLSGKNRDDLLAMAKDSGQNINDIKEEDVIQAYSDLQKEASQVSIFTIGDHKVFDAQAFQKKLKPFNVKAGLKYLDELKKAIEKAIIIQVKEPNEKSTDVPKTPDNNNGQGNDTSTERQADSSNEATGTPSNTVDPNTTPANPYYTPEELKEKTAFYIMGQAIDKALRDTLNGGNLSDEDIITLQSQQKDMQNLFNLITFGEDKDKKFAFNDGKNVVQCGKIGYIQQIIYKKATDHTFVINEDELALVLADGQDLTLGARQPLETDEIYLNRIKSNESIASILRSLNLLSTETACALVGITSTKEGENGHFAGKVNDEILNRLKDAKTPDEIQKTLDEMNQVKFNINTHQREVGPIAELLEDSVLDLAVAQSRERLREELKNEAISKIVPSDDKQKLQQSVYDYLASEEVKKTMRDKGLNPVEIKNMQIMVRDEIFAMIENGLLNASVLNNNQSGQDMV